MFVPGSPFPEMSHPFAWYALVRERKTGKQFTYWMNGSQMTREVVAEHIARHFHNVEVITIDQCTRQPDRPLMPVPQSHYGFGILELVKKYLREEGDPFARSRQSGEPLSLKPLTLKPLTRR